MKERPELSQVLLADIGLRREALPLMSYLAFYLSGRQYIINGNPPGVANLSLEQLTLSVLAALIPFVSYIAIIVCTVTALNMFYFERTTAFMLVMFTIITATR